MPVNLEVKGMLAKCLAMENIIIEHKKVPTAMFDVDRRVLTLPTWDKASNIVYDLLVAHEVGHSLATPNVDWTKDYPEVPKDFVNVLEDVRVEKLMKKKYAGLSRTFFNGYNELNSDDFFSTKEENLDELSFIDRINLYYKIGAFHNIAFNDDEDQFLTRAGQTETFDDVLKLSREIVEFVQYKRKQVENFPTADSSEEMSGSGEEVETPKQNEGSGDDTQSNQNQESGEDGTEEGERGEEVSKSMEAPSGSGNGQNPSNQHGETDKDELTSKTSRSFDEKSQDLVDKYSQETNYVELPEMILENLIIPNEFIHKKAQEEYAYYQEFYDLACKEYATYKKSAEKEVSYLVKEFECKKSADQYARASTARTGVLDTQKLHTYKFNEDLFKKVSVVPDGKNHGLIFILDWSGSMSNFILDAYKQLLNLVWFCRKVNIPFEVYAFTLDCSSYMELQPNHPPIYNKVGGVIAPEASFRLMNFFTSKTNNRVLEEQLKNIWTACYAYQNHMGVVPRHLELSGSPIGESIMALHSLIPDFQAKNKLQKVNVIFLTDGEGYQNAVTKEKKGNYGDTYIGMTKHSKTSIRDRKSGRVYRSFDYNGFPQYAKILLETVKDRFHTVNLINFRITPSRDFQSCYRWYGSGYDNYESAKVEYRKNQCISFSNTGFDQFHVIAATSLAQDEEFSVPENATKAQIKSSFSRMLGKKKTNKKLLGSFVDLIA